MCLSCEHRRARLVEADVCVRFVKADMCVCLSCESRHVCTCMPAQYTSIFVQASEQHSNSGWGVTLHGSQQRVFVEGTFRYGSYIVAMETTVDRTHTAIVNVIHSKSVGD